MSDITGSASQIQTDRLAVSAEASWWRTLLSPGRLMALSAVAVSLSLLGWTLGPRFLGHEVLPDLVTTEVTQGPFVHEVWERGELESSSNVEVRCEVRSRNLAGTTILEIVPEGTIVATGDVLVRLDDSALQHELIQQEIVCSNSEAQVIESRADLDAARLTLQEYTQGTFLEDEEQMESAVFVAEENLRRAQEYLRYSQRLSERGYVSDVQLEADEFAVEKAKKELDVSRTKIKVLRDFTKQKMLTKLQADIDTTEARVNSRAKTWELDGIRLQEIREQIAKCLITAPSGGQVVYANDANRRSSAGDLLIAEGRPVRERQVIIRLPDQKRMRVRTHVHESRISHLRPGLAAEIVLDAFPDRTLAGHVVEVSEYPLPSLSTYTAHVKEYSVDVEVDSAQPGLRPGMSAEVNVTIDRIEDAIQIPVQAVLERARQHFCAVFRPDGTLETRAIQVGTANAENIIVLGGLDVGESVILSPREIEAQLELPEEIIESIPIVEPGDSLVGVRT